MLGSNLYKKLSIKERNGKRIGLFRTICSVFGGLIVAYTSMTLLVFLIPIDASQSIIVPLTLNTLAWAITALWISVSPTKWSALVRSIVPSCIFIFAIVVLY